MANTTDATSSTDGGTIISGGMGVAKKLFVGTNLDVSGTSALDGNLTCGAQLAVTGSCTLSSSLGCSGIATISNTTDASDTSTAALVSSGGLAVAKKIRAGDLIECKNSIAINGSTSGKLAFAAAAETTDYTITFPNAVPAQGRVLRSTDTSGTLEWYEIVSSEIINGDSHIKIDVASDDIIHSVPTSKQHEFKVNSTEVMAISGTGVNVTGSVTSTSLDVNGAGDISDTLTLSKASGTGLSVTSNASIGGILACTGAATLSSTLQVDSTSTFNDAVDINAATDISSTLTCSAASGTGLAVTSNAAITGQLNVTAGATLQHSGSTKFATSSSGTTTMGTVAIDGGTGYATIEMGGDDGAFIDMKAPNGDDHDVRLRTYGDGQFQINGFNGSTSGTMANFHYGGAVELYYDNSKVLETVSGGVQITGNLDLNDASVIRFGTGNDSSIYHDGQHTYFKDNGTGDIKLQSNGSGVHILTTTDEDIAKFNNDGGCELYYDNSKTLETVSGGASVTGTLSISSTTTMSGALDLNAAADISDTLTCSKASGTGLSVSANAVVTGSLTCSSTLAVTSSATFSSTVHGVSFTATSDETLKTDKKEMTSVLGIVEQIKPYTYKWNDERLEEAKMTHLQDNKRHMGVMAQEIEAAGLGEFVNTDSRGYKAVDYSRLTVLLLGATRELKEKIEKLERERFE